MIVIQFFHKQAVLTSYHLLKTQKVYLCCFLRFEQVISKDQWGHLLDRSLFLCFVHDFIIFLAGCSYHGGFLQYNSAPWAIRAILYFLCYTCIVLRSSHVQYRPKDSYRTVSSFVTHHMLCLCALYDIRGCCGHLKKKELLFQSVAL